MLSSKRIQPGEHPASTTGASSLCRCAVALTVNLHVANNGRLLCRYSNEIQRWRQTPWERLVDSDFERDLFATTPTTSIE
jgi:hypothetical protein